MMNFKKTIKVIAKQLLLIGRPVRKTQAQIVVLAPNELLNGRCALITGGTSGIGFAIAKAFLQSGADVMITGRSEARLQKAQGQLKEVASHRKILTMVMDNADIPSMESKLPRMISMCGQIDILVNNAGVLGATLPNATEEEYDRVLDTNLKGVFFLSQYMGKYMVKQGIKGNILNIASSSSLRPAVSAYTISKWGLRGLTMGLARTLSKHGITVNGIAPGPTATPMLIGEEQGEYNLYLASNLTGRYALPEEMASMAVVLVSDMGRMVVGDIVYMTGGAGLLSFEDMNYNNFANL